MSNSVSDYIAPVATEALLVSLDVLKHLGHPSADEERTRVRSDKPTCDPQVCFDKLRSANKALSVVIKTPSYYKDWNSLKTDGFLQSSRYRLNRIFDECTLLGNWVCRRHSMIEACVIAVGQRPVTGSIEIAIHDNERAIFYISALITPVIVPM
mgnify:CR=1 FL=1